jgi:hypothetical protein
LRIVGVMLLGILLLLFFSFNWVFVRHVDILHRSCILQLFRDSSAYQTGSADLMQIDTL